MASGAPIGRSRRWLPEILLVLVLTIEAGWLIAASAALGSWIGGATVAPVLGVAPLLGLLALAAVATRVAVIRGGQLRIARVIVALIGVILAVLEGFLELEQVAAATSWQAAWARFSQTSLGLSVSGALGLALLTWWRGIATAGCRLSVDETESHLRTAVGALVGILMIDLLAGSSRAVNRLLMATTLIVLFAGLTALPLARIIDVSERSRRQGSTGLGVRGHWLAILLGTVSALLLATLLLARLLTFQRIDDLTRPLARPLDSLLWAIIYVIAVPIGLLLQVIIEFLRQFLHPRSTSEPPQPPATDWLATLRAQSQTGAGPPAALMLALKIVLIALLAGLIIGLLIRAIQWFSERSASDDVEEAHDFVFSWADARAELRRLLRSWLGHPRARRHLTSPPRGTAGSLEAWGPRELYRELLRLGAQFGRPRARPETPLEYQNALLRVQPFETAESEVQLLTGLYVHARYGETPPETVELDRARQAIERLRHLDGPDAGGGVPSGPGASTSAAPDEGISPAVDTSPSPDAAHLRER